MLWDAPGTWGLFLAPPELSDVLLVLTQSYRPENTQFWGISVSGAVTSQHKSPASAGGV